MGAECARQARRGETSLDSTRISSQSFGDLLRHYRRRAGLTQDELAARAGLSVRGLSDLERGARRAPRRETLQLLAEALALSPTERTQLETSARQREPQKIVAPSLTAPIVPVMPVVPTRASAGPFVGRERELALLEQLLTAGPPMLLLAGEPGIGKSRLLQAGIELARMRGWRVLVGGCHRRSGQEPYAPLVGALLEFLLSQTPEQQKQQLTGCTWLVRLLPELSTIDMGPQPSWTLPSEQERRLMFGAVARYLTNVAGPAGTLLVLDDLHWAGADALDLLHSLLRTPTTHPVRILGAYRDTDIDRQGALSLLVADLTREGLATRTLLTPLAEGEGTALLAALLPEMPDEEPRLRARVLERSGGVPLFLVSCVQALSTGTLTWNGNSHVPWSLRETILQRVVALPEAAQQLLRVAAVIGRRVPRGLLFAVTRRCDLTEEAVLEALLACGHARLLVEADGEHYQLTHNLVHEVLLADLGIARRALLHRRVAEVLEEGADVSSASVEALAYHYTQSGILDKALYYLERAADAARARYAYAEAVEMYEDAVQRLDAAAQAAEAARVREKLGTVLTSLARYDEALAVLEKAAGSYRLLTDQESLLRTLAQLGTIHRWRGSAQEGLQRLLPLLDTCTTDTTGATSFYIALTQLYLGIGDYHRQLVMAERAVSIARTLNDHSLLAVAQGRRSSALILLGRLVEAQQSLAQEVLPLAQQVKDAQTCRLALLNLGAISTYQGHFFQARSFFEEAMTITEYLNDKSGLAFLAFQHGMSAFYLGEWRQARSDFQKAAALVATGALAAYPPGGLGLLGLAERDETALTSLTEALALARQHKDTRALRWLHGILAEHELYQGQSEQAYARLAPLLPLHTHESDEDVDSKELLPLLAHIFIERGQSVLAEEVLTRLIDTTRATQMHLILTRALRVWAYLKIQQAQWQEAQDALEEALTLTHAFPSPYEKARLLVEYGQVYVGQGDWTRACQRFEEASELFGSLGEQRYGRHVRQLLAQYERLKQRKEDPS